MNGRINRPDTRKHLNLRAQLSKNLLHPTGRPHTDVRADVEDTDLDRGDLALHLLEEADHLVFLAGVDAERVGLAAGLADRRGQRFELVGVAAHDHRGIALAGEAPGDRPAERVAGPDDDDRLVGHKGIR